MVAPSSASRLLRGLRVGGTCGGRAPILNCVSLLLGRRTWADVLRDGGTRRGVDGEPLPRLVAAFFPRP